MKQDHFISQYISIIASSFLSLFYQYTNLPNTPFFFSISNSGRQVLENSAFDGFYEHSELSTVSWTQWTQCSALSYLLFRQSEQKLR